MASKSIKKTKKQLKLKIPSDLRRAFTAHPIAKTKWHDLTPLAQRDFISWIKGAKQPETRLRRIAKTCSVLPAGKRRPCCYALVPMKLYKALSSNPKIKSQWRNLTPNERRDFIDWVEEAKDTDGYKLRIEKTCTILLSGKKFL